MNRTDLTRTTSENLYRTYLALGLGVAGAELLEEPGFTACLAPVDHPICNFALRLDLDPTRARNLLKLRAQRPNLAVYCGPADRPEHAGELLERAGFTKTYSLSMMISEGGPSSESIELVPANDLAERLEIGRFMSDQFFHRQDAAFRRVVAEATARAVSLPIYSVFSGSQRIAAVMLSQDEAVGLYNLCVHPGFRGLGWGASIVAHAKDLAWCTGRPLTLQCETKLVPWYEQMNFETIGVVEVYDLAEPMKAVIIE